MKLSIDKLKDDFQTALKRNLDALVAEIYETKELFQLLTKATHETLNEEEKAKVNAQLIDIMKTIPALAIFALPGGAILLPIVIKILPFNILPSNFQRDE